MMYKPEDYRLAIVGEGPLADEWSDKPHRLIYDLIGEVERLRANNAALSDRIAADYQEKANLQAEKSRMVSPVWRERFLALSPFVRLARQIVEALDHGQHYAVNDLIQRFRDELALLEPSTGGRNA